jgi:hypothetical protein
MRMGASGPTQSKLARLARELRGEFAHLPGEHVEQTLFAAAEELLARAHFQDYIPLLAHRHAREQLRRQSSHPAAMASLDGNGADRVELIAH